MKNYTLECCVDTLESAKAAIEGGATRLELCANIIIGGTSPSPDLLRQIRSISDISIRAMLRPRFGDFCYTDSEFQIMRAELEEYRKLGADGVVFGILLPDGSLDISRMRVLCNDADNLNVTLHRAFDVARDPLETLEQAQALKIDTILTSGQKGDAWTGRKLIAELVQRAPDIEILAGAGINEQNLSALYHETGCKAFHLSGRILEDSPMVFRRPEVFMGLPSMSEFERWTCSSKKIATVHALLDLL